MKFLRRKRKLTNAEMDARATAAYSARARALGDAGGGGWKAWMAAPFRRTGRRVATAWRALVGREERRVINSLPWDAGGAPLGQAGIDSALTLVPVYSATSYIAETLATLPLQAFRKVGDTREEIPTPKLFTTEGLQAGQPGLPTDWVFRCVSSLLLRGNAYGIITARDQYEYPTNVVWVHPDRISCEDQRLSGPGSFTDPIWRLDGVIIPKEILVHIPAYTVPGHVQGVSPITQFATTIGVGLHAQQYGLRWFSNGGVPPGVLHNTEYELTKEETDEAINLVTSRIRSGKPLAFGMDWEYTPLTVTPQDAAFIESTKLTATEIAAIYHIHPEWIGGSSGDSMTYANVEQRMIDFSVMTLRPWAYRLESAFYQLIPRPQFVRFNLDALIRADTQTRYSVYQIARNIGLNNTDELRAKENLKPLPDGKGEDYTPLIVLAKPQPAAPSGGTPSPKPTLNPSPKPNLKAVK